MSDNAASHDSPTSEVHRDARPGTEDVVLKDDGEGTNHAAETGEVEASGGDGRSATGTEPAPAIAPPSPIAPAAEGSSSSSTRRASTSAPAIPDSLLEAEIEEVIHNENDVQDVDDNIAGEDEEGLDPDTLANLAALSRLARDEGDEDEEHELGQGGDEDFSTLLGDSQQAMTREQLAAMVAQIREREEEDDPDAEGEEDPDMDVEGEDEDRGERSGSEKGARKREETEELREVGEKGKRGKEEDGGDEGKPGKRRRKRNRTVLSCTECHRRCDRDIPCSRCIKRGMPGLCRMEAPVLPMRKKKKRSELHITHELRMRVQTLEQLIKSGLTLDPDQASSMATETIHQATRAAQSGSQDATNALAQLTRSTTGSGLGGMTSEAQNILLMDVLQQLSGQARAKEVEEIAEEPEDGQGPWSTVPQALTFAGSSVKGVANAEDVASIIDLTLPGLREDSGKIFIPPTVKHVAKQMQAERILLDDPLPVEGYEPFLDAGVKLAYGADSPAYRKERICACQSYSITGALRLASTFLSRAPPTSAGRVIYVPNPTSPEDLLAIKSSGMEIRQFRFLEHRLGGIDWEGLREDLSYAPMRSAVLLHVSGSAPTGAEFTAPQWRHLTTILLERQLIPLVIMTSQGLASGDVSRDAQPLRFMIHEGVPVVLVQSFDAMMGIYTDSPSMISVVVRSADEKAKVNSQLRAVAREMYLHPSPWGAHVVHAILSNQKLYTAWLNEIKAMADRLRSVRDKLYDVVANKLKTPGEWTHLKKATGLFCSTLLPPAQRDALLTSRKIQILPEGCVSLGALNAVKIDALARGIDHVVRDGIREAEEARQRAVALELAIQAQKEQAARDAAAAEAAAAAAEEERAREQDTLMMEESIASAMEAQKRMEEEEKMREEADREMVETLRKAEERAAIARQAEAILASITGGEL